MGGVRIQPTENDRYLGATRKTYSEMGERRRHYLPAQRQQQQKPLHFCRSGREKMGKDTDPRGRTHGYHDSKATKTARKAAKHGTWRGVPSKRKTKTAKKAKRARRPTDQVG